MNNKGFTVVELLATFTLTMVVMLFLFEIVLELKNVYVASNTETLAKNENALVASELNRKLYQQYYPSQCAGTSCTLLSDSDDKSVDISISENVVTIGVKKFEMPDKVSISGADMTSECLDVIDNSNCYFKITYTLKSSNLKKDIPFNLVLSYQK